MCTRLLQTMAVVAPEPDFGWELARLGSKLRAESEISMIARQQAADAREATELVKDDLRDAREATKLVRDDLQNARAETEALKKALKKSERRLRNAKARAFAKKSARTAEICLTDRRLSSRHRSLIEQARRTSEALADGHADLAKVNRYDQWYRPHMQEYNRLVARVTSQDAIIAQLGSDNAALYRAVIRANTV
jgi:hypothetical protein